eukprot:TRINITY_DN10980_c0_g1_i2.p1 TRINITY_DN10980_c0_g1~~TRINITY_DN10980_c0_g1_i2.p1  ORF type:complete len:194 (+),score=15.75 TRINITY_DN10980_c0_g1_i2:101-682(+)
MARYGTAIYITLNHNLKGDPTGGQVMDLYKQRLEKRLCLHFLTSALDGDAYLSRLSSAEQEVIDQNDPWRAFSPYVGSELCWQHVWLYVVNLTSLGVAEECSILAMIFFDRFKIYAKGFVVCTQNVFPLITAAYILACKVHEEACRELLLGINLCLPFMSIDILKQMERLFLVHVKYDLYVGIDQFMEYVEMF